MLDLPACSSNQVMRALERAGFGERGSPGHGGGSHRAYVRVNSDGSKDTTVVPLGKRELPRGTLRSILKLANVSVDEFIELLR